MHVTDSNFQSQTLPVFNHLTIVITYIQSFVPYLLTTTNNKEEFQVILKRMLQNYWKILEEMFPLYIFNYTPTCNLPKKG